MSVLFFRNSAQGAAGSTLRQTGVRMARS